MRPDVLSWVPTTQGIQIMRALYAPSSATTTGFFPDGRASAELTKYAAHALLATRISS